MVLAILFVTLINIYMAHNVYVEDLLGNGNNHITNTLIALKTPKGEKQLVVVTILYCTITPTAHYKVIIDGVEKYVGGNLSAAIERFNSYV